MRSRAASLVGIALAVVAGCATKVGDRGPTQVTELDPEALLGELSPSQRALLCLDVKSVLPPDVEARVSACPKVLFNGASTDPRDRCQEYESCLAAPPVDDPSEFADCPKFVDDASRCFQLTVGDYARCVRARAEGASAEAAILEQACRGEDVKPYEQPAECVAIATSCDSLWLEPSL